MSPILENHVSRLRLTLCELFKCETYGFGGIADAEGIKRELFSAMTHALAAYYRDATGINKASIDKFVSVNADCKFKSLDTISAEKGEDAVLRLFKEFEDLVQMLDFQLKYISSFRGRM